MHSHTFATPPGRPEDTPFTRPEECHCEVFTGLLKKIFLAVFCKQEMIVGEAAVELSSLILIGKKRDPSVMGARSLKYSGHNYQNELQDWNGNCKDLWH